MQVLVKKLLEFILNVQIMERLRKHKNIGYLANWNKAL